MDELVPLSVLSLDVPPPPGGWASELAARGIVVQEDAIGRESIPCSAARDLLMERRAQQQAADRKRLELERLAIQADERFRASLPTGIPVSAVPAHLTPAQVMVAGDPMDDRPRRRSVVEDALAHAGIVFTPIRDERADR